MIETIFYDPSQVGLPSFLAPATLIDTEKLWLPDEYKGGILRWRGHTFSILGNTAQQLSIDGDPSMLEPTEIPCYQIIPPSVQGLTEYLQRETFQVLSSFAQIPTVMPAITVRLEKDAQGDTYIGESLKSYGIDGREVLLREQTITGSYLLSIWAANREATLWLYSWLVTYGLASMGQFSTWGLYDIAFSGSDLDPMTQYLAERTYSRHLLLTATRQEVAITTRPVEYVTDFKLCIFAQYAPFHLTIPVSE